MSDLVDKLLAAIQEREDVAREAAEFGIGGEWFSIVDAGSGDAGVESRKAHVVKPPNWIEFNRHIALNDPASALRLCQAHREIIDQYQAASGFGRRQALDHASAAGRLTALGLVLQSLAPGYGIEDAS